MRSAPALPHTAHPASAVAQQVQNATRTPISSRKPKGLRQLEEAVTRAKVAWDQALPEPWSLVRGKRLLGPFTAKVSGFKTSDAFILAVLARNPAVQDVLGLTTVIEAARARASTE